MFNNSKNIQIALLIVVVIAIISFNFNSIVEGLTLTKTSDSLQYTQCRDASSSCTNCINAQIQDTSSPCYWNSFPSAGSPKCSAFQDTGYSRTCSSQPPSPSNVCAANTTMLKCIQNGCKWNTSTGKCETKAVPPSDNCSKYTLLQSPVYVKAVN